MELWVGGATHFWVKQEILKNTKENLPLDQFSSNFLQEGPINPIPSLKCSEMFCYVHIHINERLLFQIELMLNLSMLIYAVFHQKS